MKTVKLKSNKYICAYKVTIYYGDLTKQRTTKYTDPYDTEEEAENAAEKAEKVFFLSETSEAAAQSRSSLCVSFGDLYVFEKRYSNYGHVVKYKMKYSVQVPHAVAHCSKQKTFYTPWLNSERDCIDYAAKIKKNHGITPKKLAIK